MRDRVVLAFLLFNLLAGILFVGGALLVSFMRSFGTTPAQLGIVLGAGWAASVLGAFLGGHLTDRISPRRAILLVVALVAVSLLGKALSRHWIQAGVCYLLGMGAQAAHAPAGMALLKDAVGDEMSGSLGFLNAAFCAAAVPGAALTGWVVGKWGWSSLFMGKFVLYLAILPVLFLALPEIQAEGQVQEEKAHWGDALHYPALWWICASVFLLTLGAYCYSYYPYYVQERFTADVRQLAWFDSLYNAVWMLSNWPAGMLADRIGAGRIAMVGYALMGFTWFLFPFGSSLFSLYVLYVLYCLGNSLGFYATVFAQDVVPVPFRGRAVGLFNALMYLGSAIGDSIGGWLWQGLGARFSFALAAGANILGSFLLSIARSKEQEAAM
ncbi:MAG: MFS transporter [Chloroflexi bacterium]|nr:MFS transporter [Chloroflexota bacterium]